MAGLAAHLLIARELQKILPNGTIGNMGQFYAGSIAPDAVHSRINYVRAHKKHTHLRDDIADTEFIREENLSLFRQRVADYILEHRTGEDGLLDVYRGYVAHLLTDELYFLTLRQEFVLDMEKLGIGQTDQEFFQRVIADMHRNDFLLLYHDRELDQIRYHLEQVTPFGLEPMLSEEEITDSRRWVIDRFFYEAYDLQEPVTISFERTKEFVRFAAEDIKSRLSEGGSLPRMF